jgi:hypothetical protein
MTGHGSSMAPARRTNAAAAQLFVVACSSNETPQPVALDGGGGGGDGRIYTDEICDGFDQDCKGAIDDGCTGAGGETQGCCPGNPIQVDVGRATPPGSAPTASTDVSSSARNSQALGPLYGRTPGPRPRPSAHSRAWAINYS